MESLKEVFVTVFMYDLAGTMVIPSITDVTMSAICPGQDECSLAIFLSGFQQAMIGMGSLLIMPILGNLSDKYGRKSMLTFPMTLSILPHLILAYSRATYFFYLYFVVKTLTSMVCEGSVNTLALAYVADNVPKTRRASAFGVLSGIASASFVCGTLTARILSPAVTFKVAMFTSMLATVYMRVFLKEQSDDNAFLVQPLLKNMVLDNHQANQNSSNNIKPFKNVPTPADLICLLKSSKIFPQVAIVACSSAVSESALQASTLYFFKALFHFNKNQFADIMLIMGVSGIISQLVVMPLLVRTMGEEKLLSLGLFVACVNIVLTSIAWASWVPYAVAGLNVFVVFKTPCIRSIASKQVGPNEQGKAQGCISGITSFASIISPLIFSPLTAVFLSKGAPFKFPGFSILCIGLGLMIAFFQSILIRSSTQTLLK